MSLTAFVHAIVGCDVSSRQRRLFDQEEGVTSCLHKPLKAAFCPQCGRAVEHGLTALIPTPALRDYFGLYERVEPNVVYTDGGVRRGARSGLLDTRVALGCLNTGYQAEPETRRRLFLYAEVSPHVNLMDGPLSPIELDPAVVSAAEAEVAQAVQALGLTDTGPLGLAPHLTPRLFVVPYISQSGGQSGL